MTDDERAGLRLELLAVLTRLRATKPRKEREALRLEVARLRDLLRAEQAGDVSRAKGAGASPANTERER